MPTESAETGIILVLCPFGGKIQIYYPYYDCIQVYVNEVLVSLDGKNVPASLFSCIGYEQGKLLL